MRCIFDFGSPEDKLFCIAGTVSSAKALFSWQGRPVTQGMKLREIFREL